MKETEELQARLIAEQIRAEALKLAAERAQEADFFSSISAGITYGNIPVKT